MMRISVDPPSLLRQLRLQVCSQFSHKSLDDFVIFVLIVFHGYVHIFILHILLSQIVCGYLGPRCLPKTIQLRIESKRERARNTLTVSFLNWCHDVSRARIRHIIIITTTTITTTTTTTTTTTNTIISITITSTHIIIMILNIIISTITTASIINCSERYWAPWKCSPC